MSSLFLALAVGLGQGLLHGLGPDHCAAMATLGSGGRTRGFALWTALRFALGHAVMLALIAAGCLLLGFGISEAFERWAEIFGGVLLTALAVAALLFPGALAHGHPHLPPHDRDHRHARLVSAAGALMAISGGRSLLLALPPMLVGGRFGPAAWGYLPAFALGLLLSMGAFGLLWGSGMARLSERLLGVVRGGVAVASGCLGVFWILARL